jgi:hypothetical protein
MSASRDPDEGRVQCVNTADPCKKASRAMSRSRGHSPRVSGVSKPISRIFSPLAVTTVSPSITRTMRSAEGEHPTASPTNAAATVGW